MKKLEQILEDRHEVVAWVWKDWWQIPEMMIETDIEVVIKGDKACVLVATVCHVTRTVFRMYYW